MRKVVAPDYTVFEHVKRHAEAVKTAIREAIIPESVTCSYPKERRKMPASFRGYLIFDPDRCISCFGCAFICPANAIRMKEAEDGRYYPTIDYGKCIFCHFCLDSCPEGALKPTKIHDVAYRDLDRMLTLTEEMIEPPEIIREDKRYVEYVIDGRDLHLRRVDGEDELLVDLPPPSKVERIASCIDPESCTGCRICEEVCEHGVIRSSVEEDGVRMVIDSERCTGCGLCVKECSMRVLRLVRR